MFGATLDGGDGNDHLVGQAGTMTGGLGADVFQTTGSWAGTAVITDFTKGEDTIKLSAPRLDTLTISHEGGDTRLATEYYEVILKNFTGDLAVHEFGQHIVIMT